MVVVKNKVVRKGSGVLLLLLLLLLVVVVVVVVRCFPFFVSLCFFLRLCSFLLSSLPSFLLSFFPSPPPPSSLPFFFTPQHLFLPGNDVLLDHPHRSCQLWIVPHFVLLRLFVVKRHFFLGQFFPGLRHFGLNLARFPYQCFVHGIELRPTQNAKQLKIGFRPVEQTHPPPPPQRRPQKKAPPRKEQQQKRKHVWVFLVQSSNHTPVHKVTSFSEMFSPPPPPPGEGRGGRTPFPDRTTCGRSRNVW